MLKSNSDLENLHYTPLYSFAEIVMGQSPDSKFVNDEQFGSPFLQGNGEFTTKYPKPIHWVTHPGKMAKKGDILISVRAPVGEINIADQDYCIGRGLAAIRFKNRIDPDYGWYAISFYKGQINRFAQGSTFLAVNSNDIRSIEIPMLEESEQLKIAKVLTTVDDAIEQTEALIRKHQRIKQGLMQDLLTRGVDENGELRPAWEQHPELYKLTEYGWVPNVWNETELGSIAKVERGKFTPRPRNNPIYYQGKYPFIQTGEVASAQGRIIYNFAQTLNELGKKVSREFLQGTILVTIAANIGETGILGIPMYVPDSLVGIVVNSPHHIRFIEMILRARKPYLNARAPQSAQKNINLGDLRPMRIYLPNPKEQNLIAGIYESIEDNIDNEKKELEKLLKIKQGLMQDLLTGKVRVHALLKN